jgi:outer membrane protein OmpA-like peptidoglycan-associated protein
MKLFRNFSGYERSSFQRAAGPLLISSLLIASGSACSTAIWRESSPMAEAETAGGEQEVKSAMGEPVAVPGSEVEVSKAPVPPVVGETTAGAATASAAAGSTQESTAALLMEQERERFSRETRELSGRVRFDVNSADLDSEMTSRLASLGGMLAKMPNEKLRIEGYADNSGSRQHNHELSEQRAMSVRKVLLENGARAEQLEINGLGESRPVASNRTEEGRSLNRRVEIKLMSAPTG